MTQTERELLRLLQTAHANLDARDRGQGDRYAPKPRAELLAQLEQEIA